MEISTIDLTTQFRAATKRWPFLPALELEHGLLPMLLVAVAHVRRTSTPPSRRGGRETSVTATACGSWTTGPT